MPTSIYRLEIVDTLKSAWQRVHGSKKTFWSVIPVLFIATLLLNVFVNFFRNEPLFHFLLSIMTQIILFLFQLGIIYIGIQRAMDLPIKHNMFYRAFEREITLKAIGIYFLQMLILFPFIITLMVSIFYSIKDIPGVEDPSNPNPLENVTWPAFYDAIIHNPVGLALSLFSIAAIIYFMIRMSLSMMFIVDKKLSPLQALSSSFKATRSNFWRVFSIFLILFGSLAIIFTLMGTIATLVEHENFNKLVATGLITVCVVALVWLLPFMYIALGTTYRKLLANAVIL